MFAKTKTPPYICVNEAMEQRAKSIKMQNVILTDEKYSFYKKIYYNELSIMIRDLKLKSEMYKGKKDNEKAMRRVRLYELICERAEKESKNKKEIYGVLLPKKNGSRFRNIQKQLQSLPPCNEYNKFRR